MRHLLSLFLFTLSIFIQSSAFGQLADSPWPMFQHDAQHTGRSSSPSISQPVLKWEFQTKNKRVGSAAIGSDGTIYLVSGVVGSDITGFLYAINPDGTEKWCFELIGPPSFTTPAIASDGTIYVHCNPKQNIYGSSFLYAINYDGTLKWMFNLGPTFTSYWVSSPVIGSDGTIYFGSMNTLFYAINPDGELKWSWNIDNSSIDSSPAISSTGSIYIRAMFHYTVFSFNGNLLWSTSVESSASMEASPAISNDGTMYIGYDTTLYAYNPNGELKWKYDASEYKGILSTPAIDADSTIYLVDYGGLYALNSNGELKWHYDTSDWDGGGITSPTIASDGTIYIRSTWAFHAIDRNGKLKWKIRMQGLGSELQGAPIGSDGTLYVTSVYGSLWAYSEKSTSVIDRNNEIPDDYTLLQNYPNPFNPETTIEYVLPKSGKVRITIFDVRGNLVRTLVDGEEQPQGGQQRTWNGCDDSGKSVVSGVYFYRIQVGNFSKTLKMMLIK